MKTKISRIGKKSLSVVIALMMIVSTMLVGMVTTSAATTYFTNGSTIYFNSGSSSSWWDSGAATYIKFVQDDTNNFSWVNMTKNSDGYYYGNVPSSGSYDKLLFVRASSSLNTSNTWDNNNIYNNTSNFSVNDVGTNNCYTLTSTDGSNISGNWSNYSGGSGETTTTYYYSYNDGSNKFVKMEPDSKHGGYVIRVNKTNGYLNADKKFKIADVDNDSDGKLNNGTHCVNYNIDISTVEKSTSLTSVYFEFDKDWQDLYIKGTSPDDLYIQYTPGGTNGLAGKIKVWSVSDYEGTTEPTTTPTPTTSYYVTGRFRTKDSSGNDTATIDWKWDSKDFPFTYVDSGIYKLETNCTLKELSENITTYNNPQYFNIYDGTNSYSCSSKNMETYVNSNNAVTLTSVSSHSVENSMLFNSTDESGDVTFWLDTTNGIKFYYTTDGGTDTPNTLESGTTVYVRSSTEITAATLSTTLNSAAQETEVAMSKAGDFNAKYYYSYPLTKDADNVTFTVTLKGAAEAITKSAACVVGKNVYDVDTNTWSAYEIDKAKVYSSGLWVDVQPSVKNSSVALIKWSNQYGSGGTLSNNEYRLYLPSGVTLSTLPIYSKFSSLTINDTKVENGKPYSGLTAGTTYTVVGDGTTYQLKVYQSDAASIYTSTPSGDLPTTTNSELLSKYKADGYKPSFKNGSFMTVSENGSIKNSLTTLVQVKGRGNSSWESSCEMFGKYAYNIKLSSKIDPLGMGATKAKSFCMLANNMDEAQLRNLMTYQMGLDANIPFTPHFKAVDWYNNGTYLGSYLITEKVDVGSSKLVKGTTVEDNHEYDADNAAKTQDTYVNSYGSIPYQYVNTGDYTPGKKADGTTDTNDTYEKKSYLLEFDLEKRAKAENSWFKSPKGQYIAIKSYEDLNQAEMKFIIDKWCEAEDAVYNGNYDKANSLMDLDSFAQVYLVQELSKNLDSCATSYYVYYDGTQASPKWQATPLWDYDWAYGIYKNQCKAYDSSKEYATNDLYKKDGWFAKYKYLTQDGDNAIDNNPYSFQAQLCTMTNFWNNNVKGVWNGGFYQSAVSAFGKYNSSSDITSGKIDTVYESINDSIAMNEARYGFVANCPITSWGSAGENKTPYAAYSYFKNWTAERINWMATTGGLGTPVALTNVTLDAPTEVTVGNSITLTATVTPSTATGVTYTFYQGTEVLASKSESNTYTVTPSATGTYTYKVVATDGFTEVTSSVISVTVKPLSITGVTLKSSKSSVKPEETFTLTATATPGGLPDVTYKFYQSSDSTVSIETDTLLTSSGNTATVTADTTPGNYYYYVVAKDANNVEITSSIVTVKVTNEGAVINNVKIRFKGTTLSSLIPYMSVDGEAATVMTRSTADDAIIGTHLSGAYRFVWFEATIPTVTVGQSKTLTFTTDKSKESTMNASITLDFTTCDAEDVIYLAVDNLMSGTTAVDITDNETAKTSFGSAMNMIKQSSASDPVATTLLSTMLKVTSASGQVKTKRYYLGDLDSDNTIGIKDATEIQKSITGSSELDAEYQSLGDFNADGVVDIKDATAIQKYIAGI